MIRTILFLVFVPASLVACGGLKDDPNAPVPSGDSSDQTIAGNGDLDDDGREDGYEDQILAVQPETVKDEGTGAYLASMVCMHQSTIMWDDDGCLAGFGTGTTNGWASAECVIDADWWVIDGQHWLCSKVVDNHDEWRVNMKNNALTACNDESHPDYGSFACWGDITGNARVDPLASRNDDGSYAIAMVVIDGWIYPGSGDGAGEE